MSIQKTVSDVIEFDNYSFNSVADALEIPSPTLSRFVNEKRGIQFDFLERLCDFLQLRLVREIDFEQFCKEQWQENGKDEAIEGRELRKEDEWEEYVEENWESDDGEWEKYAKEEWKVFALKEWPEYAMADDLDVTDSEEIECWKSEVYGPWRDELYERWEESAKVEWKEMEYNDWSNEYDNASEDEEVLYEEFRSDLRDLIEEQTWVRVKENSDAK